MHWSLQFAGFFGWALFGFCVGIIAEAARWRRKGDHEYMNRIESGGRLYFVKREPSHD